MGRRTGAAVASAMVGLVLVSAAGPVARAASAGEVPVTVGVEAEPSASLEFDLAPKRLPPRGRQVAKLTIGVDAPQWDGGQPLGVTSATIGIDKAVELDPIGLPVCRWPASEGIQVDASVAEEKSCRRAVVGSAEATFVFAYPENTPISVRVRGTVFNGGARATVLQVELPVGPVLNAKVDLSVPVRPVSEGRIGSQAMIKVPGIAGGNGFLTSLRFELGRAFVRDGERVDYIDAECPNGKLVASLAAVLGDGTDAREESTRACSVAG
jgi:hypothetical protein